MYCNRCGQANPAGGKFCASCGQPLTVPEAAPAPAPTVVAAVSAVPANPRTDGMAIASLVLGVSVLLCGGFTAIPAIILGHISRSKIEQSQGRLQGGGMALAGLILGYVGIGYLILVLAAIAIPNLLRARIAANESSAVGSVRTINTAEVTYATLYPNVGFAPSLEALGGAAPCTPSPATACLIDPVLASGQKSGYRFTYEAQDTGDDKVRLTYFVEALPVKPGQSGQRFFCTDERGIIRFSATGPCTRESAPLQ